MPTLFERLDVALEGNNLTSELSGQVAQLTGIADTVQGLIQDPPDSLTDFSRILNELPFPDLLGEGFADSLGSLQQALPTELSSVVGEVTDGLSQLQSTVDNDLVSILDEALTAVKAIYRLTHIDFTCLTQPDADAGASAAPSGNGDGDGDGGGDPGAGVGDGAEGDDAPTSIATASSQIQTINDTLDNLPSPFNVINLLDWMNTLVEFRHKATILSRTLPVIDDVIDPLNTLTTWRGSTSEQVRDHLAQSLQVLTTFVQGTVSGHVAALASDITASSESLEIAQLTAIAEDLTTRLQQIKTAADANDTATILIEADEINNTLDTYDALRLTMQSGVLSDLPALNHRLDSLSSDMIEQMGHLISTLRPNPAVGEISNAFKLPQPDPDAAQALEEQFQPLAQWIQTFTDQLDFQAIQEPLTTVADTAREAVDGLEQGLTQVTIQVRAIFGELETLLDNIDTEGLVTEIEEAIDDFAAELTRKIEALFAPAREAVSQIIDAIDGQIDNFSPDLIIDPLRQAIGELTAVFEDPDVVETMNNIRTLLDRVKNQIEQVSFSPLTDQVISGLDDISDALQSIDTSDLNAALTAALDAALAILPDDLQPLTDPLVDELDDLIESGPVPLLEKVKAQPEKLMDQVRGFEPADLVGAQLSDPFDRLLAAMESFRPSSLFDPVNDELDRLKDQLKKNVNPGQLIDLLTPVFDQLLAGFNQLDPQELVAPLSQTVNDTVNHVVDALPVDEALDQIDLALGAIEDVVAFSEKIVGMFEKIQGILSDLADSDTQLTAWTNAILDKIDTIADLGPVETRFTQLTTALDETKSAPLTTLFHNAVDPVTASLATFDPQSRHTALVQAYTSVRNLPASPEKEAAQPIIDRFDPMAPEFGAPFQTLLQYQNALSGAASTVTNTLATWDDRYHDADGTLAEYRITQITTGQLRTWVQGEIDSSFLQPLKAFLAHVEAMTAPIEAVFTQITTLVTSLQDKISDLLLGPDSLGGIRDALGDLIQRIRDFNLDFLTESLAEIFDAVREKIDRVNPAQFKAPLDEGFNTALDAIDLSLIIPDTEIQALDDTFDAVIDKLRPLNPVNLVTEIIQPEYEATVVPLIDTFDVTLLLDAIIERLRTLDEELKDELERVNDAFRNMKTSVPTSGAQAGVSI